MKLRKLLAVSMATALSVGIAVSASAAELDVVWYAENNPDVVAELGNSPEALRLHYEMFGRKEGRLASDHDMEGKLRRLFNAKEYAALYPDVEAFYGEDEEAMFQHYISFGLLEARRPCEKVSQAAAEALKTTVVEAMEKAGLSAVPGSAELVAVIEGNAEMAAGSAEAVQALTQVTAEVEKAVEETVESTTASESASSGSGSSSSSSGSESSANTGSESNAGSDSDDGGSTDDGETVGGSFTIEGDVYAEKDGAREKVTSANAATYFDVDEDNNVTAKEGYTFYDGAESKKITEAEGYVTGTAASIEYNNGAKVYTISVADLDECFEISDNNGTKTVSIKSGKEVIGCDNDSYSVLSDATDYVTISGEGDDAELALEANKTVYTAAEVAVSDLKNYFDVDASGNVTLKSNLSEVLLNSDKNGVVNDVSAVTGTRASMAFASSGVIIYSDAYSQNETTKIAETDLGTYFKVDAEGTVTVKSESNAYTKGGVIMDEDDVISKVTYTPPTA